MKELPSKDSKQDRSYRVMNAGGGEFQSFHTPRIKLESSEIDINFNREIPLKWAWGSATTLGWHRGGDFELELQRVR